MQCFSQPGMAGSDRDLPDAEPLKCQVRDLLEWKAEMVLWREEVGSLMKGIRPETDEVALGLAEPGIVEVDSSEPSLRPAMGRLALMVKEQDEKYRALQELLSEQTGQFFSAMESLERIVSHVKQDTSALQESCDHNLEELAIAHKVALENTTLALGSLLEKEKQVRNAEQVVTRRSIDRLEKGVEQLTEALQTLRPTVVEETAIRACSPRRDEPLCSPRGARSPSSASMALASFLTPKIESRVSLETSRRDLGLSNGSQGSASGLRLRSLGVCNLEASKGFLDRQPSAPAQFDSLAGEACSNMSSPKVPQRTPSRSILVSPTRSPRSLTDSTSPKPQRVVFAPMK